MGLLSWFSSTTPDPSGGIDVGLGTKQGDPNNDNPDNVVFGTYGERDTSPVYYGSASEAVRDRVYGDPMAGSTSEQVRDRSLSGNPSTAVDVPGVESDSVMSRIFGGAGNTVATVAQKGSEIVGAGGTMLKEALTPPFMRSSSAPNKSAGPSRDTGTPPPPFTTRLALWWSNLVEAILSPFGEAAKNAAHGVTVPLFMLALVLVLSLVAYRVMVKGARA